MKVSIIVPVYNEEKTIVGVIEKLIALPFDKQIIVVDDGSTDSTFIKASSFPGINLIQACENFGKGISIRVGLFYVKGEIVVIQDADQEYSIDDYPKLLEPFNDLLVQVVYGSRFMGDCNGMKFQYRAFNKFMCLLVKLLFGVKITDEATAYKCFRTDVLKSLNLESNRFNICPEMTAKVLKKGILIHEVPISYNARTIKEGKKIRWTDGISAIYTLIKWRFK